MQQQFHNSSDQALKQPLSEVCNIMEIHAINVFKGALNLKSSSLMAQIHSNFHVLQVRLIFLPTRKTSYNHSLKHI